MRGRYPAGPVTCLDVVLAVAQPRPVLQLRQPFRALAFQLRLLRISEGGAAFRAGPVGAPADSRFAAPLLLSVTVYARGASAHRAVVPAPLEAHGCGAGALLPVFGAGHTSVMVALLLLSPPRQP